MKTLIFSMMLLFIGSPMIAQMDTVVQQKMKPQTGENVVVDEQIRFMSQGDQNAFSAIMPNTTVKTVESVWDKYVKRFKGKKSSQDRKTKEYFIDDCKISDISSNTIDLYCRFGLSASNSVTMFAWFDLGGIYLNSGDNPEKAAVAKNLITEFARLVAKQEAMDALDIEEKTLKSLDQDLKKLEKEKESYEKKIADANDLIAKMKTNLEENRQLQKDKKVEIKVQEGAVDEAKKVVQKYN